MPTATPQTPRGPALRARLSTLDRAASRAIAGRWPHPAWLTVPIGAVSVTANYGLLWFLAAAIPWLAGAPRPLARFAYVAGAVFGAEVLTWLAKQAVGRRRPTADDPTQEAHIPLPRSHSFPSSHASMAVAALCTLGSLYPRWLPAVAVVAVLLAFSRVYLAVHYLADVLAGLAFGTLLGLVFIAVVPAPH
jgi:membrane-associated phospholipid phosphatase